MDPRRLVDKEGFLEAYWELLKRRRSSGAKATYQSVFEELDAIYFAEYGCHRYPSYDAFRMSRDRSLRKKLNNQLN